MTETPRPYPVRVDASVAPAASRGLWLIKWLLLVPHYVVLAFLWVAFVLVSVCAFVAILFTARYPRSLFDFNVGVLRWTWRVNYYGYGALGTDRYPPFTLADVPDYPAHFDVPYPPRLSRGLVLVKWWLLAIPQYVIVGIFVGGGVWFGAGRTDTRGVWDTSWGAGGLVALLVFVSGIVLLFSGRYPKPLYDFVLGMDRWALRVAAYAALMTDEYPPFRLDMGGPDPGSVAAGPMPPAPSGVPAGGWPTPSAPPATSWTAGLVVALVAGVLVLFGAAGPLVGGGALLWADQTQRQGAYLLTPSARVGTSGYAVVSESFRLEGQGLDWAINEVVGTARLQVTPAAADEVLFLGVARRADADAYLRDVGYARVVRISPSLSGSGSGRLAVTEHPGAAPARPPASAGIWVASSSGPGRQLLTWRPSGGEWTVVVMRADGTAGVTADVRAGATLPGLGWIITGLFLGGAVLLALGGLLVGLAVHRAQSPGGSWPAGGGPVTPPVPGGSEPVLTGGPSR